MLDFPTLTFVPVASLLFHERFDVQRSRPLIARMRKSGVLRNPPIVTPLQDGSQRFMLLDGANRITALNKIGYPHVIVQVIETDDSGLGLQNWNHVVWQMNAARFLNALRCVPGVRLMAVKADTTPALEGDCGLALIKTCDDRCYAAFTEIDELKRRVYILNEIVDSYKNRAHLDRTSLREISPLREIYPSLGGLVIFPNFKIQELLYLASQKYLLPSGITRFIVSPRALHLNYPLRELADGRTLEEKNEVLKRWIQERIA
jgi:hypothetical protein